MAERESELRKSKPPLWWISEGIIIFEILASRSSFAMGMQWRACRRRMLTSVSTGRGETLKTAPSRRRACSKSSTDSKLCV